MSSASKQHIIFQYKYIPVIPWDVFVVRNYLLLIRDPHLTGQPYFIWQPYIII